jgi:hypothetical protein
MVYYNCKKNKSNPKSIKYCCGLANAEFKIKMSGFELCPCLRKFDNTKGKVLAQCRKKCIQYLMDAYLKIISSILRLK